MATRAMQAIGYVRVSTSGQAEEGISLAAQEARIRAWAEGQGIELVAVYRDEALSGTRSDRPGFLQAVGEAVRLKAVLVAYSLSRLSRSTRAVLELVERLEKAGAGLASLSEDLNTASASGRLVLRMLASLAEFEADQTRERTKGAMAHLRSQGRRVSGRAPLGTRFEDGQVVPDLEELDSIATLRSWRRAGLSFRAIQRRANRLLPARGARGWGLETIHRICRDSVVSPANSTL